MVPAAKRVTINAAWQRMLDFIVRYTPEQFYIDYKGRYVKPSGNAILRIGKAAHNNDIPYERTFMQIRSDMRFEQEIEAMTSWLKEIKTLTKTDKSERNREWLEVCADLRQARANFLQVLGTGRG